MEGPVSLCWYFFGILNLLSLLYPLLMCHTVCSPTDGQIWWRCCWHQTMVTAHIPENSQGNFFLSTHDHGVFHWNSPMEAIHTIGLSEKITQTKRENEGESGRRWRKAMRQARNDQKLWVGLFQDDVVKRWNIPTGDVNNNDFHHGTRDTLAKKPNCLA